MARARTIAQAFFGQKISDFVDIERKNLQGRLENKEELGPLHSSLALAERWRGTDHDTSIVSLFA